MILDRNNSIEKLTNDTIIRNSILLRNGKTRRINNIQSKNEINDNDIYYNKKLNQNLNKIKDRVVLPSISLPKCRVINQQQQGFNHERVNNIKNYYDDLYKKLKVNKQNYQRDSSNKKIINKNEDYDEENDIDVKLNIHKDPYNKSKRTLFPNIKPKSKEESPSKENNKNNEDTENQNKNQLIKSNDNVTLNKNNNNCSQGLLRKNFSCSSNVMKGLLNNIEHSKEDNSNINLEEKKRKKIKLVKINHRKHSKLLLNKVVPNGDHFSNNQTLMNNDFSNDEGKDCNVSKISVNKNLITSIKNVYKVNESKSIKRENKSKTRSRVNKSTFDVISEVSKSIEKSLRNNSNNIKDLINNMVYERKEIPIPVHKPSNSLSKSERDNSLNQISSTPKPSKDNTPPCTKEINPPIASSANQDQSKQQEQPIPKQNTKQEIENTQKESKPTSNQVQNIDPPPVTSDQTQSQNVVKFERNKQKYTFCVSSHNNGRLVHNIMNTRKDWEFIDKSLSYLANLHWTELPSALCFDQKLEGDIFPQYVNHIEAHSELSNKMKLFINLLKHCESINKNLFEFFPLTIIFNLTNSSFYEQINKFEEYYHEIGHQNLKNTMPYNYYFSNSSIPATGSTQKMILPSTMYTGKNLWLIKPINLNRGRNIKIFTSLREIIKEMTALKESRSFPENTVSNSNNKIDFILLQKYIESPLLYKGRKFDIRIWVLFTDKDEVFVFKEGHLKATCDKFDIHSLDPFIHLTNYSVQKHNENFSKYEIGNEISFKEFQNELDIVNNGKKEEEKINFKRDILPKIYNIIKTTAYCVGQKFNFNLYLSSNKKHSFEIFGYDFLIDSNYNPFLIEVNFNPGYEISSPLIQQLVPRLIDDALRLTIDVKFQRKSKEDLYIDQSPYKVDGYSDKENMWLKLMPK